MASETLKAHVLETLANLAGHFPQAEELFQAVRDGVPEETLLELAELLAESGEAAKEEIAGRALASAAALLASRRAEETSERLMDREAAEAALRFG